MPDMLVLDTNNPQSDRFLLLNQGLIFWQNLFCGSCHAPGNELYQVDFIT